MLGKVRNSGYFVILILTCAIIGSFIGDILSPYLPSLLSKSFEIGVKPFLINLKVLSITLGFTVSMNVMSVVGVVIALIIFGKH